MMDDWKIILTKAFLGILGIVTMISAVFSKYVFLYPFILLSGFIVSMLPLSPYLDESLNNDKR